MQPAKSGQGDVPEYSPMGNSKKRIQFRRRRGVNSRLVKLIGVVVGVGIVAAASSAGTLWMANRSGWMALGEPSQESRRTLVMQEGEVVAEVAAQVSPSVVSIVVTSEAQDFYGRTATQQSAGTGVIVSKDGYIITNKHVIPSGVDAVSVVMADGKQYQGVEVVGSDPLNDIAFLKIKNASNLPVAKLGNSSSMKVGQKVVAIGNALGEYQTTVTSGIISGIGRPVAAAGDGDEVEQLNNLFQTDAAINPGNSGGPLVNLSGEVIGINTAIAQDAEGIGFAIPINDAKGLIKGVTTSGEIKRSFLGVRYVTVTPDVISEHKLNDSALYGAFLAKDDSGSAVVSGGPADKAGLRDGDIITAVNGAKLAEGRALSSELSQYLPGETVALDVLRGGERVEVKATLEEYRG